MIESEYAGDKEIKRAYLLLIWERGVFVWPCLLLFEGLEQASRTKAFVYLSIEWKTKCAV
jgi:hypothetical protein